MPLSVSLCDSDISPPLAHVKIMQTHLGSILVDLLYNAVEINQV